MNKVLRNSSKPSPGGGGGRGGGGRTVTRARATLLARVRSCVAMPTTAAFVNSEPAVSTRRRTVTVTLRESA
jgi:hypothetical protein